MRALVTSCARLQSNSLEVPRAEAPGPHLCVLGKNPCRVLCTQCGCAVEPTAEPAAFPVPLTLSVANFLASAGAALVEASPLVGFSDVGAQSSEADSDPYCAPAPRLLLALIFVLLAAIYHLSPVALYGDGRGAGPTAASIVLEGDLDIDEFSDLVWIGGYQTTYVDGHAYDLYPWTRTIFAVPVAAALSLLEEFGVGDGPAAAVRSDTWEPILLLVPGALTTAGAATLAGLLAWRQAHDPDRRRRTAILVALGAGLATGYWSTASRGMWQHGPACLWFSAALLGAWGVERGRRRSLSAVLLGASASAAAFTRPPFLFLGAGLALWLLLAHRDAFLAAAAAAVAVATPILVVNVATYGTLMMPYYDAARASKARPDSLLYGIAGTLVSPSRGGMFFMPAALMGATWGFVIAVRQRRELGLRATLGVSGLVFFFFMATNTEGWWAGHSYGPRFLVDLVPVMMFLGVPAFEKAVGGGIRQPAAMALLILAVWSIFVHSQGAVIRQSSCWNSVPSDIDVNRSRAWDPGQAQFLAGARWVMSGHSPLSDACGGIRRV